jgi:two-component system NarL family sensor kinase
MQGARDKVIVPSIMKQTLSLRTKVLLLAVLPLLLLSGIIALVGQQVERDFSDEQQCILTTVVTDSRTGELESHLNVQKSLQQVSENIQNTFRYILILLGCTILFIIVLVWLVNWHESRLADRHLRALVHNFIQLQVDERRRFSRELHDGINQLMVATKFRIELAIRQIHKGNGEYQASLTTALDTLDECIREVRQISHGLRPDLLDRMGLETALDSLAKKFHERTGIAVQKEFAFHPATLPDDVAIMLYRVVQEALTNIERHASSRYVSIHLQRLGDGVQLDIRDDGVGFDPTRLLAGQGIGLKNMREWMELLGGQLWLDSTPGQGTRIHATLPLQAG